MIGIDTNILLRYVVDDGSPQTSRAVRFVEGELSETYRGFVSLPVFFEFVWTLRSSYGFKPKAIQELVHALLRTAQLEFEDRDLIARSIAEDGQLPDALISQLAFRHGCTRLVTFDKKFARLDGVELLA